MNEFVKVSIAGVSFNIEKKAHDALESYINELKAYYSRENSGNEIIADIEERIAELILEKVGKDNVAGMQHVEEVINTLGRPDEIEDKGNSTEPGEKVKKGKLYRDLDNKIIGGVCGGLSHFLKVDIVIIRLLFFVLGALIALITRLPGLWRIEGVLFNWFSTPVLIYIILWIVMPAAKTVTQKCSMLGISPSIYDMETFNEEQRAYCNRGRRSGRSRSLLGEFLETMGRIIVVLTGLFLIMFGIASLASGIYTLFGLKLHTCIPAISAIDYLALNTNGTLLIKLLGAIVYFIPCILMIYWGLICCFRIKAPKWRPGLIAVLVWITLTIIFAVKCVSTFKPFMSHTTETTSVNIETKRDTLYVRFAQRPVSQKAVYYENESRHSYRLNYVEKLEGKKPNLEFTIYPRLQIKRDEETTSPVLKYRMGYYKDDAIFPSINNRMKTDDIAIIKDSLITVYPIIVNAQNKYNGCSNKLIFNLPKNKVVKIIDRDHSHEKIERSDYYWDRDYEHEFGMLRSDE